MEPSIVNVRCPFVKTWKVGKNKLEKLKDSAYGYLQSSTYTVSSHMNIKYHLEIYPNGSKSGKRGGTRIYLFVDPGDAKEIMAEFCLSVDSAECSKNFHQIFNSAESFGGKFCTTVDLFNPACNFFVDGELSLKFNGFLDFERPAFMKLPLSIKWNIKESDLVKAKTSKRIEYLRSKRFILADSDLTCHLCIYPNGYNEKCFGKVFISLCFDHVDDEKIETFFTFSVESAQYSQFCGILFEPANRRGSQCFNTKDLFDPSKKFIVDEEMVVDVQGFVLIKPPESRKITVMKCKGGVAPKTMKTARNHDFTIAIGQDEITVHRKVLSDASPVFARMLESGMKEAIENRIEITDFTFEVISAATNLLYSTGFSRKFSFEDMVCLLQFADKYDINFMKDLTENFLIKSITASNVCHLTKFSELYNALKLHQKCIDFIIECSKDNVLIMDLESLDKDLLLDIFMGTFCNAAETDVIGDNPESEDEEGEKSNN